MNYKTTTFAALAAAMLLSTPVSAADSVIEFSAEASEFATEAGTKRVLKRIRVTSNVACPASAIMPHRLVRECRQELRHELITKINQQLNDRRFVQLAVASGLLHAS
ncbi:UrcA family protein [Altererythrobacter sp. GH1-8]|uniref:UrcA family protein n=1 Tax=Altererythrobacter sp. GH1-8 TaxID=3349333 RepID=UPI00374DCEB0